MNAAVAILVWIFTLIVLIVIIGEIRFRQSLKKESSHSYYVRKLDINVSDSKELLWLPGCISDENLDKNIWSTPDLIERLKKETLTF